MLSKELEKIGLEEKEANVYLALLELGEGNIQQLSRKSGVKRTTVYEIIEKLKEKSLISMITRKKRVYYLAESPQKIRFDLDEKIKILDGIMPEIMSVANAVEKKPKIRFFEGISGIKEIYSDTLRYPDQEILAWETQEVFLYFDQEYIDWYIPERAKRKIWIRAITPNTGKIKDFKNLDEKFLRKTKLIDPEKFPFNVEINLYGKSKIGIMAPGEKIGLIIESQIIYKTMKSIFEFSWENLN